MKQYIDPQTELLFTGEMLSNWYHNKLDLWKLRTRQDHIFLEGAYCRGTLPALWCRARNPYFSSPSKLLCSERRLPLATRWSMVFSWYNSWYKTFRQFESPSVSAQSPQRSWWSPENKTNRNFDTRLDSFHLTRKYPNCICYSGHSESLQAWVIPFGNICFHRSAPSRL